MNETFHSTAEINSALRNRDAHDCALVTMPTMGFWNHKVKTPEEKAHIIDRAQTLQKGINMDFDAKILHARKVIERARWGALPLGRCHTQVDATARSCLTLW